MARSLLLGVDVGTTSLKSVLCDSEGTLLAQASREYPTAYPQPNWATQDPEHWWQALCATVPEVVSAARADAHSIAGLGISCQAPTLTAVDREGHPLCPALVWLDRRADAQCRRMRDQVGAATVAAINGGPIDAFYLAPKLLWFKEHEPDLYRRTHKVLQANAFLVHRLTGALCMDASQGPLTLLFDARNQRYSDELACRMGLSLDVMPRVAPCTEIVGEVSQRAAAEVGLVRGTPVIAGMTDGTAAGLEAGLASPGDAVEMTGQSTVLLICSERPYLGEALIALGCAIPERFLVVGAMVAGGGALRWFRDQLGDIERMVSGRLGLDAFELLSREVERSPAGAGGLVFLPYMFGERSPIWDSAARGVLAGLSLATQRGDIVRAIMEGVAFGLRHNLETAAKAGFSARALACVGGGARSAAWNRIKADVLQMPVRLLRTASGAPVGDAMAAGVATGIYASFEEAIGRVVQVSSEISPDPAMRSCYDALYGVYLDLYPALKETFMQLAAVREQCTRSACSPGVRASQTTP